MLYSSFADCTLSVIVLISSILPATARHRSLPIKYGNKKMNFFVLGDWGGNDKAADDYQTKPQKQCAALLNGEFGEARQPNFFVSTGDNIYPKGVDSVHSERFEQTFNSVFTYGKAEGIPWYMVGGNHDWYGNINAQIEYSDVNPRWVYLDLFYSVEYVGRLSLKLIFIDTAVLAGNTNATEEKKKDANGNKIPNLPPGPKDRQWAKREWQWIEKELEAAETKNIKYTFVVGHYPIFSFNSYGVSRHLTRLQGLMEKYGATGFMCGHEHNLQYANVKNIHHILSGGGHLLRAGYTTDAVEKCKRWGLKEHLFYPQLKDLPNGDKKESVNMGGLAHVNLGMKAGSVTYYNCDGTELRSFAFSPRLLNGRL